MIARTAATFARPSSYKVLPTQRHRFASTPLGREAPTHLIHKITAARQESYRKSAVCARSHQGYRCVYGCVEFPLAIRVVQWDDTASVCGVWQLTAIARVISSGNCLHHTVLGGTSHVP